MQAEFMWGIPMGADLREIIWSAKLEPKDRELLTWNSELQAWTFNVTPGATCGRRCWYCYALKGRHACPVAVRAHDRNWESTVELDLWTEQMDRDLARVAERGDLVRLHSAGEFYSLDYFRAWIDLARCWPDVPFYGYTKRWLDGPEWVALVREANALPNMLIRLSVDDTTSWHASPGFPTSTVRMDGATDCPKLKFKHVGHCRDCRRCLDASIMNIDLAKH